MCKILVSYASKHGSTAEIAKVISDILREQKHDVDLVPVDSVSTIKEYDAIILGTAIYMGEWMKEALNFFRNHQLEGQALYIFASGPIGDSDIHETERDFSLPEALQSLSSTLNIRDSQLFHGKLDLRLLNLAELMRLKVGGGKTGDFRHWDHIKLWAHHISDDLLLYMEQNKL